MVQQEFDTKSQAPSDSIDGKSPNPGEVAVKKIEEVYNPELTAAVVGTKLDGFSLRSLKVGKQQCYL